MDDHQTLSTDVLVIGGGGAGCRAAMAAADNGADVLLLEKGRLGVTGSTFDPFTWGKGIIAAVEGYNPTTNPEVHFREAMAVARNLARPNLVKIVAYEAPARFRELLAMGLNFSRSQIGSCFGETMQGTVIDQPSLARAFKREIGARDVRALEKTMAFSLLLAGDGRRCAGAVAVTQAGQALVCRARTVIVATGGASAMFRYNFNAPALTGDGQVMALQAGAELTNLEFYQSILGSTAPVRLFFPQWFMAGNPPFCNVRGERFLPRYLPEGVDPAALVVERSTHGPFSTSRPTRWIDIALDAELKAGRGSAAWQEETRLAGIYCDFAAVPAAVRQELDRRHLPALAWLKARGLDLEAGPVPVAPFAHAFNGGVIIDENGETVVPGLYACGEAAAGPHGANRLGGHMFAVLLVFGARAGRHAAERAARTDLPQPDPDQLRQALARLETWRARRGPRSPHRIRKSIQRLMSPLMIAKDGERLAAAGLSLAELRRTELEQVGLQARPDLFEAAGVSNLLDLAALLVEAALLRAESRGPHYRTDYPEERRGPLFDRNLVWKMDRGQPVYRWAAGRDQ